jgi:hypothetical protein
MRLFRVLGAFWFVTAAVFASAATAQGTSNMSFGITVGQSLPQGATSVRVGRETYFVYHGSFYRQLKVGYVLVPAPLGATIKALPRGAVKFTVGKAVYFRHAGVTYKATGRSFKVCTPPAGAPAVAEAAPSDGDSQIAVEHGDEKFVFRNGRFFVKSPDGLLGRSTPVGGIARDFPPDAMSVWFRNREYFEASGVFFQEIAEGFMVVPPPWQNPAPVPTEGAVQAASN